MSGDRSSDDAFRPCVVIPTYNNPATIRAVVLRARQHLDDVIVIDDCSDRPGADAVAALAAEGLAHTRRRAQNGGKGAAVKTGLEEARARGFSHALQVDADGQHDLEDIPRFLALARAHPAALVLGAPLYDGSAPRSRLAARKITLFWTNVETHGQVIEDPMVGFRVYPLAVLARHARAIARTGDRMDFDIEVAVRLVWAGVEVINAPTRVRYVSAEEGGVSHFHVLWDNLRISWLHSRLSSYAMLIYPWVRLARWLRPRALGPGQS